MMPSTVSCEKICAQGGGGGGKVNTTKVNITGYLCSFVDYLVKVLTEFISLLVPSISL